MMKRSEILEKRRMAIAPEIRHSVDLSFQIVDRIHDILESQGLKQKGLAQRLGKTEAEISKWMRGTHNFTIETISNIETALNSSIITIVHNNSHTPKSYSSEAKDYKVVKVAEEFRS